MHSSTRSAPGARLGRAWRLALGLTAVVALGASCGGDEGGFEKSSEGFNIEPAAEVGPHAFTPSIVVGDGGSAMGGVEGELAQAGGVCDTEKFLTELQKRPDAYREWGRVLGLTEAQIPAFVRGLTSVTLTEDTKVTNHGLKNGRAYPRASVLTAGTQVLVDKDPGGVNASTTTSSLPPATAPGGGVIVTRCKCGNPLLPPVDPKTVPDEPPGTEPTATEPPGSVTTVGSSPGSRSTTSTRGATTTRSSTATTGATTSTTASATTDDSEAG